MIKLPSMRPRGVTAEQALKNREILRKRVGDAFAGIKNIIAKTAQSRAKMNKNIDKALFKINL